jgi:hypothetical protein
MIKIGEAYGFFDCGAEKERIGSDLHTIRDFAQTPNYLDHHLVNLGMDDPGDVPKYISEFVKRYGFKYAIKGKFPGASDGATADEIAHILNQTYQTPLFKDDDSFRGEVVHKDDGKPVFMENKRYL